MLSRVADSLYWIGRYLERAEHTARVVAVNLNLSLDGTPDGTGRNGGRLLAALPTAPAGFSTPAGPPGRVTDDVASHEAIAACITAARENARQVREQISSDMWEQLNGLYLDARGGSVDEQWASETQTALSAIIGRIHLFEGVTDATMTHGEGWQYIQAGRFLERAGNTATLLDVHFEEFLGRSDQPVELAELVEWVGVLKSVSAFEAYCRCYTADVRATRVAEFLILDAEFPRSIRFCTRRVEGALKAIARHTARANGRAERLAGRLRASLDFAQVDELMTSGLRDRLREIVRQAADVHTALTDTYITYPIDETLAS